MGKVSGFLDYKRATESYQKVRQRIKHFNEFIQILPQKEAAHQGARCMDCGIPFCHSSLGCPVVNLIPEWNDLIYRNKWREAYERLELTNNLPEITGRICPAPCESACTLAINDSPVTIRRIELAIIEKAFSKGWVLAREPKNNTGKSIAIIGSGPAGLSAAQQLRRMGHDVTVFEKSPKIGGLLRYGIPDFKLEKQIIDRRLDQMKAEGIIFKTDVDIGEDLSARYLKKSYNVILLATGAGQPRNLDISGRELKGIHFAMDYLSRSNMFIEKTITKNKLINAKDKNVLVIGGGDTGSDCIGTAIRQGAKQVYQIEILPKPKEWNHSWNPEWPNWPQILRTSSSQEEGCIRDWSVLTKEFKGSNGKVKKARFKKVEWSKGKADDTPQMREICNSGFSLQIDLVLLAMGFLHVKHCRLLHDLGVGFNEFGNIALNENYMTSTEGVFAAGDSHTGASLIVQAIFHGRKAAAAVNDYLMK